MDNKSFDQLLIMQDKIETNRQNSDDKMQKITEYLTAMISSMMYQIKIQKSSPYNKDKPKDHNPTNVVLANKRVPPLEGGHYTKIGGMWTVKHDIISLKLYELIIKTGFKGDTAPDVNNF